MVSVWMSLLPFLFPLAHATPAQVVIIRHAEKPAVGNELNSTGCERAYSLPHFFLQDPQVNQFGRPVAVYAAGMKKPTSSARPLQTIAPTAQALGLPVQDPFEHNLSDVSQLTDQILNEPSYNGKTVLVAWEHGEIPSMAADFGLNLPQNLQTWPAQVFDEAWIIRFDSRQNVQLLIVPERVLPGDNPLGGPNWADAATTSSAAPILDPQVAQLCVDNKALNQLTTSIATPTPNIP